MLPFLKPKMMTGLIVSKRKPDGQGVEVSHSEDNADSALEAAAEDILRAITDKDGKHLCLALRAAFQILDSEESGDDGDEDYDSQNEKAADESKE